AEQLLGLFREVLAQELVSVKDCKETRLDCDTMGIGSTKIESHEELEVGKRVVVMVHGLASCALQACATKGASFLCDHCDGEDEHPRIVFVSISEILKRPHIMKSLGLKLEPATSMAGVETAMTMRMLLFAVGFGFAEEEDQDFFLNFANSERFYQFGVGVETRLLEDVLGSFVCLRVADEFSLQEQGRCFSDRPRSPTGAATPPYGDGLDGSGAATRRFADFKMDAAPRWDGERPESQYREYARNLRMWLVEALERLPPTLIGKRIIDSIPYGSRLSASLSHLTVEQITAPDGYKEIIRLIEEQHEYLKIAKLEQAFTEAIFKGRRRQGQTISGFLATKKAGFAELKKQGLDLLATEAGEHLLGHLVLRQGGFSADQQQRIRVLTDGSIQFKKIEEAIRKIFGDAVDEAPAGRVYWGGGDDEWDPDGYPDDSLYDQTFGAHYQNEGQLHQDYGYYGSGEMEAETYLAHPGGEDVFTDLLEMDEATSEVYVCLQEPLPQMLDEAEAVEHAGELMNYVYGETAERWASKGKGKGKRPKGKGKGKSKDGVPIKGTGKNSKGFGIYGTGTYADHRRALQEARTNRGFSGSRGEFQRPRTSLQDLKNRSRCHQCQQIGHWSRDCPQRRRAPSLASSRPTSPGPGAAGRGPSGPSANMFFMSEPGPSGDDDQGMFWSQELEPGMPVYATFVDEKLPEAVLQPDRETFSAASAYMSEAIVESSALIDTAAQHGLIGEETLQKHDQLLQRLFQLRVQVTNEDGGVVRGVCGAEQITKIAYIPIGLGSKAGVLKVQVVVGHVPCLLPAYLLTKLGAVIDMCNLLAVYTEANTFQFMKRRLSGHVEVNICEFGKRWCVPETYTFLKSEVWDQGPLPTPLSELRVTVLNGSGQTLPMPSSMAPLCSAIVVFLLQSGRRRLAAQREVLEQRALRLQQQEAALLAEAGNQPFRPVNRLAAVDKGSELRPRAEHVGRSKYLTPVLKPTASCQHSSRKHGANAEWSWVRCQTCGEIEQIPKMEISKMSEWNSIMIYRRPDYKTPLVKKAEKAEKADQKKAPGTPGPLPSMTTSSRVPMLPLRNMHRTVPTTEHLDIGTPNSAAYPNSEGEPDSDSEAMERDLWRMEVDGLEKQEVEPPAMFQS
ncbi:unnamed protein product, partial [Symbiodinium microadriaticum]